MTIPRLFFIMLAVIMIRMPSAARGEDLKTKQVELQKLKDEIGGYEKKIKEKERSEHATLELLDTYDRQALLLRRLLKRLRDQGQLLQDDIDTTRRSILLLTSRLSFLKEHYVRYVTTVYKSDRTYDFELLLTSRSFNQLLVRAEYLRRFSDQRKLDLDHIIAQREEFKNQRDLLQRQLAEREDLLHDKASEEDILLQKMKKRKSLLTEIRQDKKNYRREMTRKLEAAKDMERLISRLIEEDRQRREREVELRNEKKTPLESEGEAGTAFAARRGTLRWPVISGKIVSHFGTQEHPSLHTMTQNTGIDIAVPTGTSVAAVADGEVAVISWLPSFGNLVILNHKNGYRTVYAHLSAIDVKEGEIIGEGGRLGESGEALSGPVLHFEIYKDRDKQDPEQWLRQRGLSRR